MAENFARSRGRNSPHLDGVHSQIDFLPMSQSPRYRVVNSLSRELLEREVKILSQQGWQALGEPAMATPADLNRLPYWTQAVCLSTERVEVEVMKVFKPQGMTSAMA
jgi:hypothetical protein